MSVASILNKNDDIHLSELVCGSLNVNALINGPSVTYSVSGSTTVVGTVQTQTIPITLGSVKQGLNMFDAILIVTVANKSYYGCKYLGKYIYDGVIIDTQSFDLQQPIAGENLALGSGIISVVDGQLVYTFVITGPSTSMSWAFYCNTITAPIPTA
jgi:hypothetical protein